MQTKTPVETLDEDAVQNRFHDYLESTMRIDGLLTEDITQDEIEDIRDELDTLYDIGDEVYSVFFTGVRFAPDNYTDVSWAVEKEAERRTMCTETIWEVVEDVKREHEEITARNLWKKVLPRLNTIEDEDECFTRGQTEPSDWL